MIDTGSQPLIDLLQSPPLNSLKNLHCNSDAIFENVLFQSQKPRSVFEIAESVAYHEDVDEAIKNQPWAKAFFYSPAMLDPKARQQIFVFLVCASMLIKLNDKVEIVKGFFCNGKVDHKPY